MEFTSKFLKAKLHQHSTFRGIPIIIEWPKGSVRTGTNDQGEPWKRKMEADYGYVNSTIGAGDLEPLDVYIGSDEDAADVYVVEQLKEDGSFDEYKVCLGFPDMETAYKTYLSHYPEDWEDTRVGDVDAVPFDEAFDEIERQQSL